MGKNIKTRNLPRKNTIAKSKPVKESFFSKTKIITFLATVTLILIIGSAYAVNKSHGKAAQTNTGITNKASNTSSSQSTNVIGKNKSSVVPASSNTKNKHTKND